jgi:hypothetical protein
VALYDQGVVEKNEQKEEEQVPLEAVDDLYNYAEQIRATVASYLGTSDA